MQQLQGTVLGSFHDFSFTRTFVVNAAEVENAVDDDAMQFGIVVSAKKLRVGANGVEADEQVATQFVALAIVEGDDVGIVVVPASIGGSLPVFSRRHRKNRRFHRLFSGKMPPRFLPNLAPLPGR